VKVGDIVRGAYDFGKYRTGVVLRISGQGATIGACAEVLWTTTPAGLKQKGAMWVRDLEKL